MPPGSTRARLEVGFAWRTQYADVVTARGATYMQGAMS